MMGGGMMGGYGGYGGLGLIGGILNLVITVAVIIGVVLLVIWAVRRFSQGGGMVGPAGSNAAKSASPREIAQTRYASGEITREQYQEILTDLN
jgi:putative membrane protein